MFTSFNTSNSPDVDDIIVGDSQRALYTRMYKAKEACSSFRRHPVSVKMFFHILLLLCAMFQLLVDNNESDYLRSARRTWYKFFFPPDYDEPEDGAPPQPLFLYTSDEVIETLRHALSGYETIVEKSLDTLAYYPPLQDGEDSGEDDFRRMLQDDDPVPFSKRKPQATLTVTKYVSPFVFDPNKEFDTTTETHTFPVNSTDLGMLENPETRKFILRRVVEMTVSLRLVTIELVSLRRACLIWNIRLVFSFANRGQMSVTLHESILRDCDDSTSSSDIFNVDDLLWMNLVLIFLAALYFVSIVRVLVHKARPVIVESENEVFGLDEEELDMVSPSRPSRLQVCVGYITRRLKRIFDFWLLLDFVCIFCITLSSLMNLAWNSARRPTTHFHTAIVGLGTGLLWTNLVQYFSHNKTYFALILTLERSVPKVFKFLLGIAPIFLGYSIFGVAFFGAKTVRFAGVSNSFVTLFSLLNGDAISETFRDLAPLGPGVAELYLYSFILLWTYVVLNILIAIVEESFFTSLWGNSADRPDNNKWFRTSRVPTYRARRTNSNGIDPNAGEPDTLPGPLENGMPVSTSGFSPLLNQEIRPE